MIKKNISLYLFTLIGVTAQLSVLQAVTFAQKREQFSSSNGSTASEELRTIQERLDDKRKELRRTYEEMQGVIFVDGGSDNALGTEQVEAAEVYRRKIGAIKKEIRSLEQEWKELSIDQSDDEIDGLWHQPDSTIGQLVIDYSSGDAVFVMPPDIAGFKIHLSSRLSVPKAAWNEMLDVILANFGVGIKQLTPFVKQLYFLRMNQSGLTCITDDRKMLDAIPAEERIAFVCSPPSGELRRILQFLEKFAPQDQLSVQMVGGHLVLIGHVREVKDLMKIYDFIASPKRAQEYRIITLQRADSEEVAKILTCIFEGEMTKAGEGNGPPAGPPAMMMPQDASFGFRVIPLKFPASSLFFIGKHEQIEKACSTDQTRAAICNPYVKGKHIIATERYHHPDPRVQRQIKILWLKSQGERHERIAQLGVERRRAAYRHSLGLE